jgi:hypothetical protein
MDQEQGDRSSSTTGHGSGPRLSLVLYLAAAALAFLWPRTSSTVDFAAASGILWLPFALWAAAEGLVVLAPRLGTLVVGDARRIAVARLVGGIRLLARCSAWLILAVALWGSHPEEWGARAGAALADALLGTALVLLAVLVGGAVVTVVLLAIIMDLDRHAADPVVGAVDRAVSWLRLTAAALAGMALGTATDALTDAPLRAALLWLPRMAVRWTIDGAAAFDPRLRTDPLAAMNAVGSSASGHAARAAAVGSLFERVAAAVRRAFAGDPDRPIIYGPAEIWTERPLAPSAPIVTRRQPLKARFWRNDPAAGELIELGNAILEAAHTDALRHGNARDLVGGAMKSAAHQNDADQPASEVGKHLILKRAWARPDFFAFILGTDSVVSNNTLSRLTAANLAANVSAYSRFTRGQVLAWLHTEHDPNDARADVVADDPARAGVVGTFLIFDRGEARTAPVSVPPSPSDQRDDEDDGSPFSRSPF